MMRWALLLAALVLAARFGSADDKARSRDGSSSSGGSSDAGARHHSSSSSSSSSSENHGSSSSSSSSSSASSDASDPTPAQRRHPRAGTGTGYTYGKGYYDNGYGYPYYGSFYFGYPAYYYGYAGYPAYYGQPYYAAAYGSGYPNVGSLRLIVEPEKTKVYVDSYYAGVADDFDGIFQRLHLSTGRHEITLKLDGYRSQRFRVYVPVDHTIKLHYDMVRGQGEQPDEVVGEPDVAARPVGYARLGEEEGGPVPGDAGRLRVDVRPPDSSIYVDGVFRGTARDLDGMPLPPGRHHIEIVRPGYRTLEQDVEIRSGEPTEVRADLERSS
jgi:PEGA domain